MNQRTFRMRRRVGAALLAGVTALGVATLAGEGVASAAATATTATATSVVQNIPSTALTADGGAITITPSQASGYGDTIAITIPCSTSVYFSSTIAAPTNTTWGAKVQAASCAVDNEILLTADSTASSSAVTITPVYVTSSAAAGPVALSAVYNTSAVPATTSFSVPSDATVQSVTFSVSPVTVSTGSMNNAVNPVTINFPPAYASDLSTANSGYTNGYALCLSLPQNGTTGTYDNFNTSSGTPTVSVAPATGVSLTGTATLVTGTHQSNAVSVGTTATSAAVLAIPLTGTAAAGSTTSFYLSGLHVDGAFAGIGTVSAGLVGGNGSGCAAASPIGSTTLFTVGTTPAAIYGQTPDATAAAIFDSLVSVNNGVPTCNNGGAAVVTTDIAHTNGVDALSAAYLEQAFHTGVLITPQNAPGSDLLAALKYGGVSRVYVVGGPLAISPSVISALQSTPAYTCGGLSTTGSNLQVIGPIYGTNADQTAAAIDNFVTPSAGNLPSVSGAYSAATSTTGGGLYNQTSGNASASGPTSNGVTAFVVSNTDFRDDMAASGLAYKYGIPIILTPSGSLGTTATNELKSLGVTQVVALGGNLALSNSVVTSIQSMGISVLRIAGYDYTQTAADLAEFEAQQLGWTASTVLVAQGEYWSDAIAAAPISGLNEQPLLLTEGPTLGVGQYTLAALKLAGTPSNGLGGTSTSAAGTVTTSIQVLGGPDAVTPAQTAQMQAALTSGASS